MGTDRIDHKFWQGRRVFLTGHTGFKGSWLTMMLSRLGAVVCGYALDPPTTPSLYDEAGVGELVETDHRSDLADLDALCAAMNAFRPELVLHMAAQSLVRQSYIDPLETYRTNVIGTLHVLEAARRCDPVTGVINVTTDKCYAHLGANTPFKEDDPMGGADPYSNSKGCSELVTACYRRSFMEPEGAALLASARAGNVIGGGDWATDRLLPDCYRAFSRGETLVIRYPDAVRPWQLVLEPLAGYLRLGRALLEGKTECATGWNFGPTAEDAMTVGDVAAYACAVWGDGAKWVTDEQEHPHEEGWLQLDSTAAHTRLGWRPKLDAAEAVDWTIQWYRDYSRDGSARALCTEQIERYVERES
jgi:CDP-glucose 4,6-dehydratase